MFAPLFYQKKKSLLITSHRILTPEGQDHVLIISEPAVLSVWKNERNTGAGLLDEEPVM